MFAKLTGLYQRLQAPFKDLREVRQEEVPYLTRFTLDVAPTQLPKIKDFPGLIFIQHTENLDGKTELTAYWKSREAATSNSKSFNRNLQVGTPSAEAYLQTIVEQEKPWFKRIPIGRWVLYAASLFGAFAVLQDNFAQLFEKPDIGVQVLGPPTISVLQGEEINLDVEITNRSREVNSVVTLSPLRVADDGITDGQPKFFVGNLKPAPVSPLASIIVRFTGGPLGVGRYSVLAQSEATTGYFPDSLPFLATKGLEVWSIEPQAEILDVSPASNPSRAFLKGRLLVGAAAPTGIACQATIQAHPAVTFLVVDFPGASPHSSDPDVLTPGREVRTIRFESSRPFEGLKRYPFSIALRTGDGTIDWNDVKGRSSVDCDIR